MHLAILAVCVERGLLAGQRVSCLQGGCEFMQAAGLAFGGFGTSLYLCPPVFSRHLICEDLGFGEMEGMLLPGLRKSTSFHGVLPLLAASLQLAAGDVIPTGKASGVNKVAAGLAGHRDGDSCGRLGRRPPCACAPPVCRALQAFLKIILIIF